MNRKLRALGLVLFAALATSAVAVSSASAVTDVFTTTQTSALMTGTSHDNIFAIPGSASFQCTTSKFAATGVYGSPWITVDPSYAGKVNETPHGTACTASIGSVNALRTNECHYRLSGSTDIVSGDGPVWIECGAIPIEIASSLGITISIPSQTTTSGGVSFVNLVNHPGGSAVRVQATVKGITFTCAPAFTCALGGIPTHGNNAEYNGTVTMTGYEDIFNGLPTPIIEGSQIPIVVS